jgi:prepilin-type N-terminal cleavage/methylation domain-containing protein
MKTKTRAVAAFTLLEIMIVVAIIGLLMAIAIPNWAKTRSRAQIDTCRENLSQIETAKQLWGLETGKTTGDEPVDGELFGVGLYLKSKPECPAGGTYTVNPIGTDATCSIAGHEL